MHDDKYIYLFVRQDIPPAAQVVQAAHAACMAGATLSQKAWLSNLVAVGVANSAQLEKAMDKCTDAEIRIAVWTEPDMGGEVTAFATEPVSMSDAQRREAFKNYRLLKL